ncbi:site-specific integrase [Alteromonas sediminis]|uniref:Site-specific integrase n=1 Tax=Alteromonas sediminis TaxID=2259342 RepID=A0A3N5Y437_9ALTE|nr:tyrosine-type recombinase/integrase [Alteromonas sediminis]RPJ68200.1 site-specific integrase [Alteromonas sediminis]
MAEIQINLTDKIINSIKRPINLTVYCDARKPNLKLIVRPSGRKSFYFRGKRGGKDVKRKIGDTDKISLASALLRVEEYLQLFDGDTTVKSSSARRTKQQYCINDVFELYRDNELRKRQTIAGRAHGLEVAYRNHVKMPFGGKLVAELTKKEIRSFFQTLESKGYSVHNKALSVLKSAFNYVIDYEEQMEIQINPFARMKKMKEVSRNRYLTYEEAKRLLSALEVVKNQHVADIYRIALFTGARLSNIKQMRWIDLNLYSAIWFIPATNTKTGLTYEIPLHDRVMVLLKRRSVKPLSKEFVFPSLNKSKYGYITGGDNVWKEAIKIAGLYHENPNIRPRPHDLRRTFATWQIQSGADISIVSKSLCHTSLKHTMIYAHTNIEQVRESLVGAFKGI